MNEYRHHVSGFFAHHDEAGVAFDKLVVRGLPREQMHIFSSDTTTPASTTNSATAESPPASSAAAKAQSNEVLKDMVVDGAIGTAVGTGIGLIAEVALVAANVSLFVASPLLAPLAMLGWGASLGATVGAMVGANGKKGVLSSLVGDAISSGQVVLVVQTRNDEETTIAREVIEAAVGKVRDVVAYGQPSADQSGLKDLANRVAV